MRRVRTHLALLGAVTTALFALNVGVPRAGAYYHTHAGGDHLHVHADEDGAAALLADLYGHHHHHHDGEAQEHEHASAVARQGHGATAAPIAPVAWQHDDGPSTGHWHQQDHFQRALAIAPVLLADAAPVAWIHPAPPHTVARAAARDVRARGPPVPPQPA